MKKYLLDFTVSENVRLSEHYILLKLHVDFPLPEMCPGQFVEIRIDETPEVLLRRPISIHFVDYEKNMLWLLIQLVGKGTVHLSQLKTGDLLNVMLPLGNGFTLPQSSTSSHSSKRFLLVGGGAGIAPMLFLGEKLYKLGHQPYFLLGARSRDCLFQTDEFARYGKVSITTEDGSLGEKGFVTQHSMLASETFELVYVCGPKPMMMAVAKYAHKNHFPCEVSLENKMACGLGACLCCVENTNEGNVCVCKEGPVFNINQLLWQI